MAKTTAGRRHDSREVPMSMSNPADPPAEPGLEAAASEAGPSLIRPRRVRPTIDLSNPLDAPDLPDGEWSRAHLNQFLGRQPYDMVFIKLESYEDDGEDHYQTVGFQGHWFSIRKGEAVSVPVQIAAIIKQSQEKFPTMQSQAKKRLLTDLSALPAQNLGRRGLIEGVEVAV